MEDCIIIVPTFSQYIDVCKIFFELFKKNWRDCPYRIVLSVIGENVYIDGVENLYVGTHGMLTDAVKIVKETYSAEYYMSLLGDNFISENIDTGLVENFVQSLKKDNVQYCAFKSSKEKSEFPFYRNVIPNKDSYVYSFAHFIATGEFIDDNIIGMSDFEFEKQYHENCIENKIVDYSGVRIMTGDIFHFVSMCSRGKWFRTSYRYIKKRYPYLDLATRKQLSYMEQIRVDFANLASKYLTVKAQYQLKKKLKSIFVI